MPGHEALLSREEFKRAVFQRDQNTCVSCGAPAVDAHHIIERRLFPDGGYYLSNGVALCADCHLSAEATLVSCDALRAKAGIGCAVLPPHFYPDETYDKWGNPILPNGQRLRGELFHDASVQKVLAPMLHRFTNRVKYPRTWHVPWSPGATADDRVLETTDHWIGSEVVITYKMDGENTTLYRDYMHARSIDYSPHPSTSKVKALHATMAHDIPEDWRICGENLTAVHSIKYPDLHSIFQVFSIWNAENYCLSWAETVEWCALLGLSCVPLRYKGLYLPAEFEEMCKQLDTTQQEGLVVRPAGSFHYRDFPRVVGKYVRAEHVRSHAHWKHSRLEYNDVRERTGG